MSHFFVWKYITKIGQAAGAGGERGIGGHATDAGVVHQRQRRRGVEPAPAEPEDQAADDGNRIVAARAAAITLELAASRPSMMAPAMATQPPIECTTVEPAKSWKFMPRLERKLFSEPIVEAIGPQHQWPKIG